MTITLPTSNAGTSSPRALLEFYSQYPAPMPELLVHENQELLNRYLTSWSTYLGPLNHSEDADFEHFVETAARFDSALHAFGPEDCVLVNSQTPSVVTITDLRTGAILPDHGQDEDFVWGPVASKWGSSHGLPTDPADAYWKIPAFKEFAGRELALAGFCTEDGHDIVDVLGELFDQGVRDFVVKGTASKTMLERFILSSKPTSLFGSGIPEEVYGGAMHREGRAEVFLVQEAICMLDEYRLFMVGPNPVTGAGCIEEFTPLDGIGETFDPRVSGLRSHAEVRTDPARVAELVAFGRELGASLFAQAPDLGTTWVLDVAMNPETGTPIVIELNPSRNAGLYASRPEIWMSAAQTYLQDGEAQ